jgi:hypothetical protein
MGDPKPASAHARFKDVHGVIAKKPMTGGMDWPSWSTAALTKMDVVSKVCPTMTVLGKVLTGWMKKPEDMMEVLQRVQSTAGLKSNPVLNALNAMTTGSALEIMWLVSMLDPEYKIVPEGDYDGILAPTSAFQDGIRRIRKIISGKVKKEAHANLSEKLITELAGIGYAFSRHPMPEGTYYSKDAKSPLDYLEPAGNGKIMALIINFYTFLHYFRPSNETRERDGFTIKMGDHATGKKERLLPCWPIAGRAFQAAMPLAYYTAGGPDAAKAYKYIGVTYDENSLKNGKIMNYLSPYGMVHHKSIEELLVDTELFRSARSKVPAETKIMGTLNMKMIKFLSIKMGLKKISSDARKQITDYYISGDVDALIAKIDGWEDDA